MTDAERADAGDDLRIRDVVERTGIGEATLRAWETRHGFPQPERLPSGHRRYSERDVAILLEVQRARESGIAVAAAIERARRRGEPSQRSIFNAVRRRCPELQVNRISKSAMLALTHAIEDESALHADGQVLFASFQRERHFRAARDRWTELARCAEAALVFADFERLSRPADGPVEVPVGRSEPLTREWSIVSDAQDRAACLVGWEPPGQGGVSDRDRVFDAIWTVEHDGVREAARVFQELAVETAPDDAQRVAPFLAEQPVAAISRDLRHAVALTNRMVGYLARGER